MKKTVIIKVKALCTLLLIALLFSGENIKTNAATHIHNLRWVTIRAATCSQSGYQVLQCSCGMSQNSRTINPTGRHSWLVISTTQPTCTSNGTRYYKCNNSGCTATKSETIPALGHQYRSVTVIAPTCHSAGKEEDKCIRCGHTIRGRDIPTVQHNWSPTTKIDATCTKSGTQYYKCSNSGCTATKSDTIPALGHQYRSVTIIAPTCHSAGKEEDKCIRCGHTIRGRDIPTLPHNWGLTSTTQPTCTSNGTNYYKCNNSGCSATKSETIPTPGHQYRSVTVIPPTCHSAGKEEDKCIKCGHTISGRDIPTIPHNWVLTSRVNSTWTKSGVENYKCTYDDCNNTYSKVIPPLESVFADINSNQQYIDAIKFVSVRNIMNGKGTDPNGSGKQIFDSNATLTRAEFATVLYNIEKASNPAINYENKFADVKNNQWYTNSIMFVTNNGLMSGYGNGNFGVSDPITKEQMAAVLYKYVKWRGYKNTIKDSVLDSYVFDSKLSSWAEESMQWALTYEVLVSNGTDGNGKKRIDPQASVTRAECAVAIKNMFDTDGHIEFKPMSQWEKQYKEIRSCNRDSCDPFYDNGCCAMSTVNAVGYLTGNTMDINEVAQILRDNNLHQHNPETGAGEGLHQKTPKVLAENLGNKYGFKCDFNGEKDTSFDSLWNTLCSNLKNGKAAVVHVKGHYIALVDYDISTGKILVYDSAAKEGRGTTKNGDWKTYDELINGKGSNNQLKIDRLYFCLISRN